MSLRKHANFSVSEHFYFGLPGVLKSTDVQEWHQENKELKLTVLQAVGKAIASVLFVGPEQQQ